MGYTIRRQSSGPSSAVTHLEACLKTLLSQRDILNIVQVGANDGLVNDPIRNFVWSFRDRTNIILVEPQPLLIPILEHNYGFHPSATIANCAIGPGPAMQMHCVRSECWGELVVPYAIGWPAYRAPTGITSVNPAHVIRWLAQHYRGGRPLADLVETVSVPVMTLEALLAGRTDFARVDLLQIDAEGFDDEVIYASNIAELRPALINFEAANLDQDRLSALSRYLQSNGYALSRHGGDALAIRMVPEAR